MRAARSEYDAPAVRTADASDIGPQHPARHGQNDREIALGRKNHLFAGSDGGAERWAVVASLLATAKLNGVEPFAYLKDLLERLSDGHPMSQLDDLLPWNWASPVAAAA
jgi:transposase IS66-like protein